MLSFDGTKMCHVQKSRDEGQFHLVQFTSKDMQLVFKKQGEKKLKILKSFVKCPNFGKKIVMANCVPTVS